VHDEAPGFPNGQKNRSDCSQVSPDEGNGNPPAPIGLGEVLLRVYTQFSLLIMGKDCFEKLRNPETTSIIIQTHQRVRIIYFRPDESSKRDALREDLVSRRKAPGAE
jgi:hypothetical protein